jgi:hypothetical protein
MLWNNQVKQVVLVGSDVVLAPVVFLKTRWITRWVVVKARRREVTPGQPKAFILRG